MWLGLNRLKQIGLFILAALLISYALLWLFEERFDQNLWKSQPKERYKMVDHLIEQGSLIGKTKGETTIILGVPNETVDAEKVIFLYEIGEAPSFFYAKKERLLIAFEEEKVVKVVLTED